MGLIFKFKHYEIVLFFATTFYFTLVAFLKIPFSIPSLNQEALIEFLFGNAYSYTSMFLLTILVITIYSSIKIILGKQKEKLNLLNNLFNTSRLMFALSFSGILNLAFKWIPHIGKFPMWDNQLHHIDSYISPIIPFLNNIVNNIFPNGEDTYGSTFFIHFFIAYIISLHCYGMKGFQRIVSGTIMVLVLGGISYLVFPAYGPFIFEPKTGIIGNVQSFFIKATNYGFVGQYGNIVQIDNFCCALGAVPSLHVAHMVLLFLYIRKTDFLVGLYFFIQTAMISIMALTTEFHYSLDLIAGILLAIAAFLLNEKLIKIWDKNAKDKNTLISTAIVD